MFLIGEFFKPDTSRVANLHTAPKSTDGSSKQVVSALTPREVCLQRTRDESFDSGWCTDPTGMRAIFLHSTYSGASVPKVSFGAKPFAIMVALAFAINLLCSGCGTGMTVVAMESPTISQVSPQVVTA